MYAKGDVVVYRHYVCEVQGVREAYYEGRDYFELKALFEKSMKLFVEVDEGGRRLRDTMSKREALELIDSIVDVFLEERIKKSAAKQNR